FVLLLLLRGGLIGFLLLILLLEVVGHDFLHGLVVQFRRSWVGSISGRFGAVERLQLLLERLDLLALRFDQGSQFAFVVAPAANASGRQEYTRHGKPLAPARQGVPGHRRLPPCIRLSVPRLRFGLVVGRYLPSPSLAHASSYWCVPDTRLR